MQRNHTKHYYRRRIIKSIYRSRSCSCTEKFEKNFGVFISFAIGINASRLRIFGIRSCDHALHHSRVFKITDYIFFRLDYKSTFRRMRNNPHGRSRGNSSENIRSFRNRSNIVLLFSFAVFILFAQSVNQRNSFFRLGFILSYADFDNDHFDFYLSLLF